MKFRIAIIIFQIFPPYPFQTHFSEIQKKSQRGIQCPQDMVFEPFLMTQIIAQNTNSRRCYKYWKTFCRKNLKIKHKGRDRNKWTRNLYADVWRLQGCGLAFREALPYRLGRATNSRDVYTERLPPMLRVGIWSFELAVEYSDEDVAWTVFYILGSGPY